MRQRRRGDVSVASKTVEAVVSRSRNKEECNASLNDTIECVPLLIGGQCADASDGIEHWLLAAAIFFVTFLLYFMTAYPTVPGGDSGELIVQACNLGVAHPPGYPLWTMLGFFFCRGIPFGTPAWRLNIFSGLVDSGAALMLYRAAALWSGSNWGGVLAAGLFALSPQVWLYATQGEVFALNNFLLAALLFYSVRFSQTKSTRVAYLGAFLCGCGISNQMTIVFLEFPVIVWVLFVGKEKLLTFQGVARLSACFLLGLLPYAYLPLASALRPTFYSWGNTSTLGGFFRHVLRAEYGTLQLYSGENTAGFHGYLLRLMLFASNLAMESQYVGLLFALVGLGAALFSKRFAVRGLGVLLFSSFVLYVGVFFFLANMPTERSLLAGVLLRFFPQANMLVFMCAALGLPVLVAWLGRLVSLSPRAQKCVVALISGILVVRQGVLHYASMDQSGSWLIYEFGHQLLDPLPQDSVLYLVGDVQTNAVIYLQQCENHRPDVVLLSLPLMTYEWFNQKQAPLLKSFVVPGLLYFPGKPQCYSLKELVHLNNNGLYKDKQFYTGGYYSTDESPRQDFVTPPYGLSRQFLSRPRHANTMRDRRCSLNDRAFDDWYRTSASHLPRELPNPLNFAPDSWEREVLHFSHWAHHDRASLLLDYAIDHTDVAMMQESADAYEFLFAHNGVPDPHFLLNAGIAYGRLQLAFEGKLEKAQDYKRVTRRMVQVFGDWLQFNLTMHGDHTQIKAIYDHWRPIA